MSAYLSCPYCNAHVPAPATLAAGARVSCPRCDEVFPFQGGIQTSPDPTPAVEAITASPSSWPGRGAERPRRSNLLVGGIVLGVMLLMALTGLTYALLTQHVRREHDTALPRRSRRPALPPLRETAPVEPVAPARLAALGYLPARTGIIVGLHVQEALASPAGKEWRDRPLKLAGINLNLGLLRDWTGLDVQDIDHAVVGVRDAAAFPPPVHLVVRTRRPFNANQLRAALKAGQGRQAKAPDGEKRTLYSATVRGLDMTLWLPDNRTVVLGLFGDLSDVPARPDEGLEQLPVELRLLLEKRLASGMLLWAVGHSADWKKTWLPTRAEALKDVPLLARLEQMKGFAAGAIPDRTVKIQAAFECIDEAAARQIETEELAPRAKKQPEKFKYGRDGAWLDVQWKVDAGP